MKLTDKHKLELNSGLLSILIFWFILLMNLFLFAQNNSNLLVTKDIREIYESRLLQLEFLLNNQGVSDSLVIYLKEEAQYFAIESDSVVLEELHNPFLAIRLSKTGQLRKENFQFYQFLRGDQDQFQTSTSFSLESNQASNYWRVEGISNLFWQHQKNLGNFWENQISGVFNQAVRRNHRFYLYSQIRHKLNFTSDSSYGNIFAADLTAAFRFYTRLLTWTEFSISPSYYNENQVLGLCYSQIKSRIEWNNRLDYNNFFQLQFNHYYRSFRSRQPDEDYINFYQQVQPTLEFEFPIYRPFGVKAKLDGYSRWYGNPDVSHSDFYFFSLSTQIKIYLSDFTSLGIGYVYELENHRTKIESEKILVEQENFKAKGIVISADILNTDGLILTLSYQFTLRDYPNAVIGDFFNIYSNRRIHSLYGIGYIPLSAHWQFQFFANYDNDRDRDREANDNFSTIFNLGLVYKF